MKITGVLSTIGNGLSRMRSGKVMRVSGMEQKKQPRATTNGSNKPLAERENETDR